MRDMLRATTSSAFHRLSSRRWSDELPQPRRCRWLPTLAVVQEADTSSRLPFRKTRPLSTCVHCPCVETEHRRNSSAPESYTLTKKSAGLRTRLLSAARQGEAAAAAWRRDIAPTCATVGRHEQPAELSSLAHPTRGEEVHTVDILRLRVSWQWSSVSGGTSRCEEDGVDTKPHSAGSNHQRHGHCRDRAELAHYRHHRTAVSSAVSRTTPPGDFAGRLCTRTLSSL